MLCGAPVNFFVTDEELEDSPSRKDGVDAGTETMLRNFGAEMIQEMVVLLRAPQAVAATAQCLLQRFYCQKSLKEYHVKVGLTHAHHSAYFRGRSLVTIRDF